MSEGYSQITVRDSIRVKHVQARYLQAADGDANKASKIAIIQLEFIDRRSAVLAREDIDIPIKLILVGRLDSTRKERLRAVIGDDRFSRKSLKDKPGTK